MNKSITNYQQPITIFAAEWVLPICGQAVEKGAVAIENAKIIAVGTLAAVSSQFPDATLRNFGTAAILPGFVNAHTHLELTAMRGFLDEHEREFSTWLLKLAAARDRQMSVADLESSALCGAIEAARAGVTCLGDIGKHGFAGAKALREIGLRGISFQENSFAADGHKAPLFFEEIIEKIEFSQQYANERVRIGITPHTPFTVSIKLFELITDFALSEKVPLTIHVAESKAEDELMRCGTGSIAAVLNNLGIIWNSPKVSSVEYLHNLGVFAAKPLLAHCVKVDERDLEIIRESEVKIVHCPKSNAKFSHGVAPLSKFLQHNIKVGLGSDSVASNNTCDLLEEARFAIFLQRINDNFVEAKDVLRAATLGGAEALGLECEIGSLETDKAADLTVISLDALSQQPIYSPEAALVFASSASKVVFTMVAGQTIYDNGVIQTVDETVALTKLQEAAQKIKG